MSASWVLALGPWVCLGPWGLGPGGSGREYILRSMYSVSGSKARCARCEVRDLHSHSRHLIRDLVELRGPY